MYGKKGENGWYIVRIANLAWSLAKLFFLIMRLLHIALFKILCLFSLSIGLLSNYT